MLCLVVFTLLFLANGCDSFSHIIRVCYPLIGLRQRQWSNLSHDDVIKWKHFPRYWPFVRGIHRSPVNSPHKGQWRGALMFSLICIWINSWVNTREAGDCRRYRVHYDVIWFKYLPTKNITKHRLCTEFIIHAPCLCFGLLYSVFTGRFLVQRPVIQTKL